MSFYTYHNKIDAVHDINDITPYAYLIKMLT